MGFSDADILELPVVIIKDVLPPSHDRSLFPPHPPCPPLIPPVAETWDEVAHLVLQAVGVNGSLEIVLAPITWLYQLGIYIFN